MDIGVVSDGVDDGGTTEEVVMKVAGFGCARLRGGGVQGRHSILFFNF